MADHVLNPAEQGAAEADAQVLDCLQRNKSFRLEAGAGAGKTHSLIKALQYLVKHKGNEYAKARKRIACITYTNAAKDEIDARTDRDPIIYSGTIHSFSWSVIQGFQPQLRRLLPSLPRWPERIAAVGEIGTRKVVYDLGHPKVEQREILLGHDDVLALISALLPLPKFRRLMTDQFPIILIDEYQDTDRNLVIALKLNILDTSHGPLLGLFGDSWQKIYGTGCGGIDHESLQFIGKEANFRSAPRIVDMLNRMRPELPQRPRDPAGGGFVGIYHTNDWPETRRTGQHWGGDLPAASARRALELLKTLLAAQGWELEGNKTKILLLTHRGLAAEQGYDKLLDAFEYNDSIIKKENAFIAFFADKLEPACDAYHNRQFGRMFSIFGADKSSIKTPADKSAWAREMDKLISLCMDGSIGDVLEHLKAATQIPFPESLLQVDRDLARIGNTQVEGEPSACTQLRNMLPIRYREVTALLKFIEGYTPFETKHGVKGAEFENVVVVFGRGWNQYNFGQFLEWNGHSPPDKTDAYERNRNLFYVVCSRPKQRLALLFTQKLSSGALSTLAAWFGNKEIHSLPNHA